MSTFARILAELSDPTAEVDSIHHEHSPFHLSGLADCYSPDSSDSPGAEFLASVARDVAEHVEPYRTDEDDLDVYRARVDDLQQDAAHEIADSAVPIYTHDRWATFVDLGAYNEDVTEFVEVSDLTDAAGVALYMIASRLVAALAQELTDALDEEEDDQESDLRASDDYNA